MTTKNLNVIAGARLLSECMHIKDVLKVRDLIGAFLSSWSQTFSPGTIQTYMSRARTLFLETQPPMFEAYKINIMDASIRLTRSATEMVVPVAELSNTINTLFRTMVHSNVDLDRLRMKFRYDSEDVKPYCGFLQYEPLKRLFAQVSFFDDVLNEWKFPENMTKLLAKRKREIQETKTEWYITSTNAQPCIDLLTKWIQDAQAVEPQWDKVIAAVLISSGIRVRDLWKLKCAPDGNCPTWIYVTKHVKDRSAHTKPTWHKPLLVPALSFIDALEKVKLYLTKYDEVAQLRYHMMDKIAKVTLELPVKCSIYINGFHAFRKLYTGLVETMYDPVDFAMTNVEFIANALMDKTRAVPVYQQRVSRKIITQPVTSSDMSSAKPSTEDTQTLLL